jgi:hypothetical protein
MHCASCGHRWFAANTAAMVAIERAYRAEIAELSGTFVSPSAGTEVVQIVKASAAIAAQPGAQLRAIESAASGEEASIAGRGEASPGAAIGHHLIPAKQVVSVASGDLVPRIPEPAVQAREDFPCTSASRKHSPRRQGRWTSIGAGAVIPSLIAANLGLVGWRADLARLLPQTAALYAAIGLSVNIRGVAFAEFSAETAPHDAGVALVLKGNLVNATAHAVRLPELRFALRDEKGREVYGWTEPPPKGLLAGREVLPFESRLPAPPDRGKEVVVRFVRPEESYSVARKFPLNVAAGVR